LTDDGFVERNAPDPDSPAGQLVEARKLIVQEKPSEALKRLKRWRKDHPNHPLLAEAYLLQGDAKMSRGDYYASLYDYEQVIELFPASEQFLTAIEREYEIAVLYATGVKRKLWGVRWVPAGGEAEELFIRIQERMPQSDIGEKASIALADYYYRDRDMPLAAEAYDLFLSNYPESDLRQWALLRLIQASLARFKGPEFDATGLIDAAERVRQYQAEYPAGADRINAEELLVRINESLARRDFATAAWYDRTGEDVSAALLYRRLIQQYPVTAAARESASRLEAMGEPISVTTAD
jgi:outer membrane protein assembly factor BamD